MIKKLLKFLFHRVVLVAFAMLVQIAILVLMIVQFQDYFVYFYGVCFFISLGVVLHIINSNYNPAYKIVWMVPLLLLPIFGWLFYLMFGNNRLSKKEQRRLRRVAEQTAALLPQNNPVLKLLEHTSPEAANQSRYIERYAGSTVFRNTITEYLPLGEVKFERMKQALQKAEHFIFLEYFIIQEGKMWNPILEILKEKAAQGVDVRLIYDDMGCLMTLPYGYNRKLEAMGIQCCIFNPFRPVLNSRFNNRDHRKICVIDGNIGFTGGINLADEYINAYPKHGHWKDTAILLYGDAVWDLTLMFLTHWTFLRGGNDDFAKYCPQFHHSKIEPQGFVQPFGDSPLDDERVAETVYLNLITRATRYVHITTPYLIIDNELVTALCGAAKQGVDVRIITPHIADKWYVHAVTRSYYELLTENGVRIYEYTPGFIHAKTFVVDDEYAVVGTINLDYRSLYLHFECGVWMYQTESVSKVQEDFEKTLSVSKEVTLEDCRKVKLYQKLMRSVLRVFAPLM